MIFEIKNVKYMDRLSEDSHCFSANLWVDGKRFCAVSDHGQGGGISFLPLPHDDLAPNELYKHIAAIESELPQIEVNFTGEPEMMDNSLEIIVGELVNEWLRDRELKKMLRKVVYFNGHDLYTINVKPEARIYDILRKRDDWKQSYVILNELPMADARVIFDQVMDRED